MAGSVPSSDNLPLRDALTVPVNERVALTDAVLLVDGRTVTTVGVAIVDNVAVAKPVGELLAQRDTLGVRDGDGDAEPECDAVSELLEHIDALGVRDGDGDAEPARDAASEPLEHAVALGDRDCEPQPLDERVAAALKDAHGDVDPASDAVGKTEALPDARCVREVVAQPVGEGETLELKDAHGDSDPESDAVAHAESDGLTVVLKDAHGESDSESDAVDKSDIDGDAGGEKASDGSANEDGVATIVTDAVLAALRVGGAAVIVTRCVPLMELSGDGERRPDTVRDTDAPAVMTVRVMLGLVVVLRDRVGDGDCDIVADDFATRETVARFDTKDRVGVARGETDSLADTRDDALAHIVTERDRDAVPQLVSELVVVTDAMTLADARAVTTVGVAVADCVKDVQSVCELLAQPDAVSERLEHAVALGDCDAAPQLVGERVALTDAVPLADARTVKTVGVAVASCVKDVQLVGETLVDRDGAKDAEPDSDALGEALAHADTLGVRVGAFDDDPASDAVGEALTHADADNDREAASVLLAQLDAEGVRDGDCVGELLRDGEGEPLPQPDCDGEREYDGVGELERDGCCETLPRVDADGERDADVQPEGVMLARRVMTVREPVADAMPQRVGVRDTLEHALALGDCEGDCVGEFDRDGVRDAEPTAELEPRRDAVKLALGHTDALLVRDDVPQPDDERKGLADAVPLADARTVMTVGDADFVVITVELPVRDTLGHADALVDRDALRDDEPVRDGVRELLLHVEMLGERDGLPDDDPASEAVRDALTHTDALVDAHAVTQADGSGLTVVVEDEHGDSDPERDAVPVADGRRVGVRAPVTVAVLQLVSEALAHAVALCVRVGASDAEPASDAVGDALT